MQWNEEAALFGLNYCDVSGISITSLRIYKSHQENTLQAVLMSKDRSGFASDRTAPLQIVLWECLNTEG
jgi:hypothetical protein